MRRARQTGNSGRVLEVRCFERAERALGGLLICIQREKGRAEFTRSKINPLPRKQPRARSARSKHLTSSTRHEFHGLGRNLHGEARKDELLVFQTLVNDASQVCLHSFHIHVVSQLADLHNFAFYPQLRTPSHVDKSQPTLRVLF